MNLPLSPPVEPMLAKLSSEVPEGDGWLYEPKWDGFRALVFRDGDESYVQSRDLKPMAATSPSWRRRCAPRCRRAPSSTERS